MDRLNVINRVHFRTSSNTQASDTARLAHFWVNDNIKASEKLGFRNCSQGRAVTIWSLCPKMHGPLRLIFLYLVHANGSYILGQGGM